MTVQVTGELEHFWHLLMFSIMNFILTVLVSHNQIVQDYKYDMIWSQVSDTIRDDDN